MRRATAASVGLSALLTLGGLTGCGGDDPRSPAPGPLVRTDYPTAAPQPDAAAVRRAMADTDTGRFETTVDLPGTTVQRSGVYRLSDGAARATTTVTTEESEVVVDSIAVDGLTFARIDDGEDLVMDRCWLQYDVAALASAGRIADAVVTTVPPEVRALAEVRDGDPDPTAPLYPVVSSFGTTALAGLGITPDIGGRAPVGYRIEDGEARYAFDLERVLAAVAEQGVDLPDEVRSATTTSRLSGLVSGAGEPVVVTPPPPGQRVVLAAGTSRSELAAALAACEDPAGPGA